MLLLNLKVWCIRRPLLANTGISSLKYTLRILGYFDCSAKLDLFSVLDGICANSLLKD